MVYYAWIDKQTDGRMDKQIEAGCTRKNSNFNDNQPVSKQLIGVESFLVVLFVKLQVEPANPTKRKLQTYFMNYFRWVEGEGTPIYSLYKDVFWSYTGLGYTISMILSGTMPSVLDRLALPSISKS